MHARIDQFKAMHAFMNSYSMWGPRVLWAGGTQRHTAGVDDRPRPADRSINNPSGGPGGRAAAGRESSIGTWRHMTTPPIAPSPSRSTTSPGHLRRDDAHACMQCKMIPQLLVDRSRALSRSIRFRPSQGRSVRSPGQYSMTSVHMAAQTSSINNPSLTTHAWPWLSVCLFCLLQLQATATVSDPAAAD